MRHGCVLGNCRLMVRHVPAVLATAAGCLCCSLVLFFILILNLSVRRRDIASLVLTRRKTTINQSINLTLSIWQQFISGFMSTQLWGKCPFKRRFSVTTIWAPPSEFVCSSIPSWQILTAHAQSFRGVRDLAFCLKVPLASLLVWASSEGSGETARMRRLAWTFAARICDKYQIRLTRSIWFTDP